MALSAPVEFDLMISLYGLAPPTFKIEAVILPPACSLILSLSSLSVVVDVTGIAYVVVPNFRLSVSLAVVKVLVCVAKLVD